MTALPVLPLKNTVVFPHLVVPLSVGREKSLAAVHASLEADNRIITVAQRDPDLDDPGPDELHPVATIANVSRIEKRDEGAQVVVQGMQRISLKSVKLAGTHLVGRFDTLPEVTMPSQPPVPEVDALHRENLRLAHAIALLYDSDNGEQIFRQLIASISNPVAQMYRVASLANLSVEAEQDVLEQPDVLALMRKIQDVLVHEEAVTKIRRNIAEKASTDLEQQQRDHVLRQQKSVIESALGETDEDDLAELRALLDEAQLPDTVRSEADRELKRLGRMSPNAPDYQVGRSYLELLTELPWHQTTEDQLDLVRAQQVLDEDHFGLQEVKERIVETLAVMQLNPQAQAPIFCLVGPPGVGKTSLGQSIARAMGRSFERLSLGGLHDEAELRGHRRTYIGAMPGRIIQALRHAEVTNPVIMLDEIDKLSNDFHGDPSAALMEILDPAQNSAFRDNFLNLPYDLSKVMFVTTANSTDSIAPPLLDRMELVELPGYAEQEKLQIAARYLVPRARKHAGLPKAWFNPGNAALSRIIHDYTREAGVRELERVLGTLARKQARRKVEAKPRASLAPRALVDLLGPAKFSATEKRKPEVGTATGLAWTPVGGEVLYVEACLIEEERKLVLTGHLGKVMQESAQAALSHLTGSTARFRFNKNASKTSGLHVHVPSGAVPKDGPSAGVTMITAMASALSGLKPRAGVAMTGEISLNGRVMPVGGIREKLLAAHRHGIRELIIPQDNERDLNKLDDDIREGLQITLVSHVDDGARTDAAGLDLSCRGGPQRVSIKPSNSSTSVRQASCSSVSDQSSLSSESFPRIRMIALAAAPLSGRGLICWLL